MTNPSSNMPIGGDMSSRSLPGYEPVGPSANAEPSALANLIARVEAATEGSDRLDVDVWVALGLWAPPKGAIRDEDYPYCWTQRGALHKCPFEKVSRSLDAALGLAERVLPGWSWLVAKEQPDDPHFIAWVGQNDHARGSTPALALCLAILKARSQAGTAEPIDLAREEQNPPPTERRE